MSTISYRNLLSRYPPKPIHTDEDYRRTLAQIERLMIPKPRKAQSLLIEVLATLIEKYEEQAHPIDE